MELQSADSDMKNIFLGKSKIHGSGIFAKRGFKKGQKVIVWSSHKQISEEDIRKLPKRKAKYISYIKGKYIKVPPEASLNHSCDPNVCFSNFSYIAKRTIKKGEELTTDYRKETGPGFRLRCKCGSKNCVGVVTTPKKSIIGN